MIADEPRNHHVVFFRERKSLAQGCANEFAVFGHRRLKDISGQVGKRHDGILLLTVRRQ